jgi:hypothetical protein
MYPTKLINRKKKKKKNNNNNKNVPNVTKGKVYTAVVSPTISAA